MEEQNTNVEEQNIQSEEETKKEHKPFKRFIALGLGIFFAVATA